MITPFPMVGEKKFHRRGATYGVAAVCCYLRSAIQEGRLREIFMVSFALPASSFKDLKFYYVKEKDVL
jgi:hypothetical protein